MLIYHNNYTFVCDGYVSLASPLRDKLVLSMFTSPLIDKLVFSVGLFFLSKKEEISNLYEPVCLVLGRSNVVTSASSRLGKVIIAAVIIKENYFFLRNNNIHKYNG